MLFINPEARKPTYITIEEVSLQKFTGFQDFNLTFVEYLTRVLSNYTGCPKKTQNY